MHFEQGVISFTLEELKGVPNDVISGYTKRTEGSKEVYDVTHKTPDIFPVVRCFCTHLIVLNPQLIPSPLVQIRAKSGNSASCSREL